MSPVATHRPRRRIAAAAGLVLASLAIAAPALGVTGSLDPTYGSGGKVVTEISTLDFELANAAVTQIDGKAVVAGAGRAVDGTGDHFVLVRYDRRGRLDPTFGVNGRVVTDFAGSNERALGLARQADGKLIAAGFADLGAAGGRVLALARYLPDGRLDESFDGDGRVTTNVSFSDEEVATAVLVQPDGRIVAGGSIRVAGRRLFLVARYSTSGALETTYSLRDFDSASGSSNAQIAALALAPDGKLVAAGTAVLVPGTPGRLAVARYDQNGGLDSTFGSSGQVTASVCNGVSVANALVLQSGRPVLAGQCVAGGSSQFALARFTTTGATDRSFGVGGVAITPFQTPGAAAARALAFDVDGSLIAAGHATVSGSNRFALVRYDANGRERAGGRVLTDFQPSSNEQINALTVERTTKLGPIKLIAAGSAVGGTSTQIALARYR